MVYCLWSIIPFPKHPKNLVNNSCEEHMRDNGYDVTLTNSFTRDDVQYYDEEDSDIPDPIIIVKSRHVNKKTILNVGGERHEVSWRTLRSAPYTRLGKGRVKKWTSILYHIRHI